MNTEQPSLNQLDALIDHEHGAAVKAEEDALAIERRLRLANLPHSAQWFSQSRAHGETRNPYGGKFKNLTIRAGLEARDPALASFLARAAGTSVAPIDYAARERQAAREAAAERMVAETERLRTQNDAVRARQAAERHANLPNRGGGAFFL
jgi:hypothetical protein